MITRLCHLSGLAGLLLGVALVGSASAVDVTEGTLDAVVSSSTSAQPVSAKQYPRLETADRAKAPYVGIVRFPVQPGGRYTLIEVYPAEPHHRMELRGYFPLSQDNRRIKGQDTSRSQQSTKSQSKTGQWAQRSNFSIAPASTGRYLYYVYYSETPSEKFTVQVLSQQLSAAEVRDNTDSPYSKAKGVFWGDPDFGEVFAEVLPGETPRKDPTGGSTVTTTTTKDDQPGRTGDNTRVTTDSTGRTRRTMVKAESRRVRQGQTVAVPMLLMDAEDLAGLNVAVSYDVRGVQATVRPEEGVIYESQEAALFESNIGEAGMVRFAHATTGRLSGSGTLTSVTFRAVGAPGTVVALRVQIVSATDSAGAALPVGTIDGTITIEGEPTGTIGDHDKDGIVSVADAKSALKMAVKLIPEDLVCDVDGDGVVTPNDARILLAQATATFRN